MAESPSSKKKAAAPTAGAHTYRDAVKALGSVEVSKQEFGRLNKDGTILIDAEKLTELKEQLGEANWGKVRFMALNAPFKRRSPTPPA